MAPFGLDDFLVYLLDIDKITLFINLYTYTLYFATIRPSLNYEVWRILI